MRGLCKQGEVGLIFVVFLFCFVLFFLFLFFVFRYSNWVGKLYFDIQNPILTFKLSQKILLWNSKSYFDIRTESENPVKIDFEYQNKIFRHSTMVKIGFWISK